MGVLDGLPAESRGWLDELDPETLEVFDRLDGVVTPRGPYGYIDNPLFKELSGGWGEAEWRATALWAQLLTLNGDVFDWPFLIQVAKRKLNWTPHQRDLLWRTTGTASVRYADTVLEIPVSAVRGLPVAEREPLVPSMTRARREMDKLPHAVAAPVVRRLDDLLAEHLAGEPAAAVHCLLPSDDAFAELLHEEYGERLGHVLPMVRHWATAIAANPSARWTKVAAERLTPEAVELIREILGRVPAYREKPRHNGYVEVVVYMEPRTADLLRGMIWTCSVIDEPWVTGLLGDVALATGTGVGGSGPNSRNERVANAALGVLDRRGGLDVVPQLARVQAKVRKKSILTKVAAILVSIGAREGLSPDQLLERTVPAFGLGFDGTRTDGGLTLSVTGAITYDGRKTIPKSVDRALLAKFRAAAAELKKALPAERFRVERALAAERVWRWRDACALYLDHPVTGGYARTLIWEVVQGPAGLPARVEGERWELTDPVGRRVGVDPETPVRLWHPLRHTADEVRRWRDHLLDAGLRQPFKQVFREVYLLTPAEEETRDHSRRFADHRLRYGQAKALLTERGWTGMSLGHWDAAGGSDQCTATKGLPGGLTVAWDFWADVHADDHTGTVAVCVSGDVRFHDERGGRVALAEVPPLLLSEALRDADLAVGVTSTGLDPEGDGDYWRSYGFGDLTESAKTRRDALTRLLPRLAIADRCALTDRFLVVRGELRTYKIHLGSGNILMEPNDAYLCIVPTGGGDRVFLPFEEDGGMLSVVLSKAFLLAADAEITDPSITHQILR
ncbi:DUF4132 domain-containing protein [Herbidospora galbida]|uniref:DUF4132 domain-containing protein n=1 Tax=Herbidospora galbida TaxID=2575442 RepID=A0A4U3M6G9_9ACTN|nr:DUF4132 domain-containing protein [Herbidospora galbida]TKK83779.1 DUF4132 domain-containing protein [Herbidospora galbida]